MVNVQYIFKYIMHTTSNLAYGIIINIQYDKFCRVHKKFKNAT